MYNNVGIGSPIEVSHGIYPVVKRHPNSIYSRFSGFQTHDRIKGKPLKRLNKERGIAILHGLKPRAYSQGKLAYRLLLTQFDAFVGLFRVNSYF
jgi:hypothetical protein